MGLLRHDKFRRLFRQEILGFLSRHQEGLLTDFLRNSGFFLPRDFLEFFVEDIFHLTNLQGFMRWPVMLVGMVIQGFIGNPHLVSGFKAYKPLYTVGLMAIP